MTGVQDGINAGIRLFCVGKAQVVYGDTYGTTLSIYEVIELGF